MDGISALPYIEAIHRKKYKTIIKTVITTIKMEHTTVSENVPAAALGYKGLSGSSSGISSLGFSILLSSLLLSCTCVFKDSKSCPSGID